MSWRGWLTRAVRSVWPGGHPRDPALAGLLGLGRETASGVAVDADMALRCPAVAACVGLIADTIATLPLELYRRVGDDRERARGHPLRELMRGSPNDWQSSADFRRLLAINVLLHGNAYALPVLARNGTVLALEPLDPLTVAPQRIDGRVWYRWSPSDQPGRLLAAGEILHVRGRWPTCDGLAGRSPVEMFREQVGLALAITEYSARFFSQSATPAGVFELPGGLDRQAINILLRDWDELVRGARRSHRNAVLPPGIKYHKVGASPADAALVEVYRAVVADIAGKWFGLPPHMIGETDRETSWGTGIEQQAIGFLTYILRPWLEMFEEAFGRCLFSASARTEYYFEFAVDGLLRGDTKSRYDGYALLIQWGLASANEIRRRENWPAIAGGDDRLVPLNMAPADLLRALLMRNPARAERALAEIKELTTGGAPLEVPAASASGPFFQAVRGQPTQPRDQKGRFASGHRGFKVGRLGVGAIGQALKRTMVPGDAVVGPAVHRKLAAKHADDYPVCRANLKKCLSRPDFAGVRREHPDNVTLVLNVKGLPKGRTAMIAGIAAMPDAKGRYAVVTAYGVNQDTITRGLKAGWLRPVVKTKGPPKRAFCA